MNAAELKAHAVSVLSDQCCVEERAAVQALEDAASELGVRLSDLAALVVAASLVPLDGPLMRGALVETTGAPGEDQPARLLREHGPRHAGAEVDDWT